MTPDEAFAILEAAAASGQRCPQSQPHGPLDKDSVKKLAVQGRVRSEVFAHNWRVVTILVGPQAGNSTAGPPGQYGKPHIVMDANGTHMGGRMRSHGGEIKRVGPSPPRNLSKGY